MVIFEQQMKSWLSSPLVINYVLSLCKNGQLYQNKYLQVYKELKVTSGFTTKNRLFLSQTGNADNKLVIECGGIERVQFGASEDLNQHVVKWTNQHGNFHPVNTKNYVLSGATSLLCNISVFKGPWKWSRPSPVMKVYNSFSYTEDIKYEARLIELPMEDDFKLVIIVPNHVSSISELFNKLVSEGMAAAVGCVRPLFTFSASLESPSIDFSSEDEAYFTGGKCNVFNVAQIGNVLINENGTNISIVTLLSSTTNQPTVSADEKQSTNESPFYFAVLYKDVAVFTGRYVKNIL